MSWIARVRSLLEDRRIRFLLVGGVNTGVGYLLFVAVALTAGRVLDDAGLSVVSSVVSLLASHLLASVLAFVLYRKLVFRVTGHVVRDFIRFQGVYALSLGVNTVALPVLVELGVPRLIAQACIVVVTALVSYFGHRSFSFRRDDEAGSEA